MVTSLSELKIIRYLFLLFFKLWKERNLQIFLYSDPALGVCRRSQSWGMWPGELCRFALKDAEGGCCWQTHTKPELLVCSHAARAPNKEKTSPVKRRNGCLCGRDGTTHPAEKVTSCSCGRVPSLPARNNWSELLKYVSLSWWFIYYWFIYHSTTQP